MSSDWMREHKETNAAKGGALMGGVCVAFMAKVRGVVSLVLLGVFQCLWTGCVRTKTQMRPKEVRRKRGVCAVFRAKVSGVVWLMLQGGC
jgi:uncharacterized membrane protein